MRIDIQSGKDEHNMWQALRLAYLGKGTTAPNPMVGAVIIKNKKVVGTGYHRRCGGDHAEIIALKKAGDLARGATLYINLEPCHHVGHTPPCVDQVIQAGIKEVFIAMKDPNPLTNGKSIRRMRKAGIAVHVGLLQKQALKFNEIFVTYTTKNRPFITAKIAQTLDGKIAGRTGQSKWITSEMSRRFARQYRDSFDAIMVGGNTVKSDNPGLNGNKKKLIKIVLDSHLAISNRAKLFEQTEPSNCILATTQFAPEKKKKMFQNKGVHVLIPPTRTRYVPLPWLFQELAKREITNVLLEGGAHVIGSALKERLVDKMMIYIAPKFLGDQNALSSIVGLNIENVQDAFYLEDIFFHYASRDEDIILEGYPRYLDDDEKK